MRSEKDKERMKLYEYNKTIELKERYSNEIQTLNVQIQTYEGINELKKQENELKEGLKRLDQDIHKEFGKLKDFVTTEERKLFKTLNDNVIIQKELAAFMCQICEFKIKKGEKENILHEIEQQKQHYEKQKERSKIVINQMKKKLVKYTAEQMVFISELPEDIEQLEKKIASELAKIAFINTDKEIMRDFREKEQLLNNFHLKEIELENKKKLIERDIDNIKKNVLNNLQAKIKQVNDNFASFLNQLNFDGKIVLETENLKVHKWKLNILVKFRKDDEMQQLCSYIQSGGERSVSTIIFLLSLLETTPAPFRLVDEINQGMDAYNEKGVHNILVNLTKSEDSPQFFIITPKLVEDLHFNDQMKIFVIYSGCFDNISDKFEEYKKKILC